MNDEHSFRHINHADEGMEADAKMLCDGEAAAAFVGDGGILSAASMQVRIEGQTQQQQIALLDEVHKVNSSAGAGVGAILNTMSKEDEDKLKNEKEEKKKGCR